MNILLLEPVLLDADLIGNAITSGGIAARVRREVDRPGLEAALEAPVDVILCDYALPGWDAGEALALCRARRPDTPFIFVSAVVGEEFAVEALKAGAADYVTKGRLSRLVPAIDRALAEAQARLARERAEAQLRLLVLELRHRIKNTLASVSALNWLTARHSQTLAEFQAAFAGRIQALSQAHELLFETRWRSAELAAVLRQGLAPFMSDAGQAFRVDGDPVTISPRQAVAVTLVVHELATNAAKYGALSRPGGKVRIHWTASESGAVRLTWTERGGPPTVAPGRRGFGSTLIERTVADDLEGRAVLDYQAEGLTASLSFTSASPAWDSANLDVSADMLPA